MAAGVQRLFVGHMGCYAALPGLGAVADFVAARGRPAVLLCAGADQPAHPAAGARVDTQQIVAHALFSDAAVAAVVRAAGRPAGYEVLRGRRGHRHHDRRPHDLGRHRPRLPDGAVAAGAGRCWPGTSAGVVDDLLARHGLGRADVDGWAVHPGGPRILDVVQRQLALPPDALAALVGVLRRARQLLVGRPCCWSWSGCARPGPCAPGRHLVALAFGPGLTLYAALLRAT